MAGFGFGSFVKPQATSVRPGDLPSFGDLSAREKLLMLGATLRGDMQGAQQIPMMAAARQKQAGERQWRDALAERMQGVPMRKQAAIKSEEGEDLSAAFSPQFDTVRGPRATLRDLSPEIMKGMSNGYKTDDIINLLDKTGPRVKFESGLQYDELDPSSAPKFIPKLSEGERVLYDENQNPYIVNIKGKVEAVSELERAKSRASEEEKARLDVGKYDLPDGSTQQMPRLEAAGALSGVPMRGGGRQGSAGVPGGATTPPGLGRTQTQEERLRVEGDAKARDAYTTDAAKAQVERDFTRPKAEAALNAYDGKSKVVTSAIKRARGMVSGWTAGPGSMLAAIPGTPARDLKATLEIIKSNLGFDELQTMRDNSPTGGALGAVAVQELEALRSTLDSLDQAQSPGQIDDALTRLEKFYSESGQRKRAAFAQTYGPDGRGSVAGKTPAGGAGGYSAADKARAAEILRQRRAAKGQ